MPPPPRCASSRRPLLPGSLEWPADVLFCDSRLRRERPVQT
ncbi:hypothetical protein MYA_2089 [Burkholderia sp. KJ006]|nr:hypothetical protein MYA_2089 [Burkholderia sp. KJ006]